MGAARIAPSAAVARSLGLHSPAVTTLQQAARAPSRGPEFWWRVLSPLLALFLALIVSIFAFVVLTATSLSDAAVNVGAAFVGGLAIAGFSYALWAALPAAERRDAIALVHSRRGALGMGIVIGIGIIIASGAFLVLGTVVDPGLEDRLEDTQVDVGDTPALVVITVIALVVLAPLGEEMLFRALLLRGLAARIPFWWAALISTLLFTLAHPDATVGGVWPRLPGLIITGLALAWLYRWRGYWAGVSAHATVNLVAAVALIASG